MHYINGESPQMVTATSFGCMRPTRGPSTFKVLRMDWSTYYESYENEVLQVRMKRAKMFLKILESLLYSYI